MILVLSVLSKSVWLSDWSGEVCGVNQCLFVVNDVNFPHRGMPLISIFLTVAID